MKKLINIIRHISQANSKDSMTILIDGTRKVVIPKGYGHITKGHAKKTDMVYTWTSHTFILIPEHMIGNCITKTGFMTIRLLNAASK